MKPPDRSGGGPSTAVRKAAALRAAVQGPPPDLSGGYRYLQLERMAYYVHKDTYRAAVRSASAALADPP